MINLAQGQLAFLRYGEQPGAAIPFPGGCPAPGCADHGIEDDLERDVQGEHCPSRGFTFHPFLFREGAGFLILGG